MHMARKGTNASGMRRYNQRLILSAIRRLNGASKAELSRVTGLSPQAVVRIIDELDNDGLLFQAEKRTGGMGQPATVYRINGARGYTVGVDIGRNAMTLALLDFDGQRRAVQCDAGAFPTIDLAVARIDRFVQEQLPASLRDPGTFLGIGIAMPWFLGEWRDELGISEHQAREWRRGDVADRLRAGLDGPTFFDNDGNAATLAHLLCGAGVDLQNYLCINLGTFVGGGWCWGAGGTGPARQCRRTGIDAGHGRWPARFADPPCLALRPRPGDDAGGVGGVAAAVQRSARLRHFRGQQPARPRGGDPRRIARRTRTGRYRGGGRTAA